MTAVLIFAGALFATTVTLGVAADVWVWWRPRRQLARAFAAAGRCDRVVHLPEPRPVEAWPVHIAIAGEAA